MGGTGLYVGALVEALRHRGHAVAVVAPGSGDLPLEVPPPERWEHTWRRPEVDGRFREIVRRWLPDVVHVHHLAGLSFGVAAAARERARLVLTLHDYAIPCARGQLVDRDGALCPGPSAERCAVSPSI